MGGTGGGLGVSKVSDGVNDATFYQMARRLWPVVGAHLIGDPAVLLTYARSG